MTVLSALFWALVMVTAAVSYRWSSIVGLIFFLCALATTATVASHWGLR